MTPAARIAAAIEVLDQICQGAAAEQALTRWARASRFAGSKDRAAVRDHVFDVMRVRRSAEHLGGGVNGRALMLGLLRHHELDPTSLFTGEGHAPKPLSDDEISFSAGAARRAVRWNIPDWVVPILENSANEDAEAIAIALQARAPVFLRVNQCKASRDEAARALTEDGIDTKPNPLSETALTVVAGARRVKQSIAYQNGMVELQDAASQAVCDLVPDAARYLDFCAGGGGKSLALASRAGARVMAHDISPQRMKDLPERARRAGVTIDLVATDDLKSQAPFDAILCDAPCSGSGAWRRSPEGKWRLTPDALTNLCATQDDILRQAAGLLAPGGTLVYATCSVFSVENEERVDRFLKDHHGWRCRYSRRFSPGDEGDGFFTAHLTQE